METINGTIDRINFAQNGFLIAKLETGHIILGNCTEATIGQEYEFRGQWTDHPKFGRQFKFDHYRAILPQDLDGIRRYIVRARWVGPVIARKIVKEFGEDALAVLKNDPERVMETISGITLARAQEISQTLKNQEKNEAATIELESMLGGQHLPKTTIPSLITKYGHDAPAQVRQNPYGLIEDVRGIGFPTADRVAMALKYEKDSIERRMAASLYALQDAAESRGHTWLPGDKFAERVGKLISLAPGEDAILTLLKEKKVEAVGTFGVALADLARDETDVAGLVRMLLCSGAGPIDLMSLGGPVIDLKGLAPDQQESFRLCMANPVFILTGAPGTGKTYTLRRIIEQFTTWNFNIALAAPTGKAAKRMSEMIDRPASTIHRLLGPEPYQEGTETKFSFHYGVGAHLPFDLVVIDEFSMVDVSLAASLFRAIAPGTRVLIVGDHYQLPSVGPGAVLRDLLAAGLPSYELTEIKRNTGDIVKACHAIKDGRPAIPSPTLEPEAGYNLRHIEESDPVRIQQIIREIFCERMHPRGYDPVWDVQVLSPMNERTLLSCLHMNEMLQGALNIHPPIKGTPFRIGDKVLQRKNESIDDEFVVNGDLGTVLEISDSDIFVMFRYPDRKVRIKRKDHHITLAYCITIHKLQGSESPVIIFPVHSSFGGFFSRELLYTGISRAKDICITIGEWSAVEAAGQRATSARRITRLTELLKG
ncbi:MAG: AAA family ATPase [Thermodesulfobacteriota bacterium]|nr:AAA family ATPase [Thermodesulfobacteriota bacterium]